MPFAGLFLIRGSRSEAVNRVQEDFKVFEDLASGCWRSASKVGKFFRECIWKLIGRA
jgi:hypothetical protein